MQEKCVRNIFTTRIGAFGNNIGKEPQKPRPKLKNMDIIYLHRISGSFLQTCINFVEQRLKFSHFEGSIIP